tara:strand:- start:811 stop:1398 length:588 start_codon:yes stop_codon:yes gene_type:complete
VKEVTEAVRSLREEVRKKFEVVEGDSQAQLNAWERVFDSFYPDEGESLLKRVEDNRSTLQKMDDAMKKEMQMLNRMDRRIAALYDEAEAYRELDRIGDVDRRLGAQEQVQQGTHRQEEDDERDSFATNPSEYAAQGRSVGDRLKGVVQGNLDSGRTLAEKVRRAAEEEQISEAERRKVNKRSFLSDVWETLSNFF